MDREKERRDQKMMKNHRKDVKVHNKTIANRSNRAGVIKQINMIPPKKLSPKSIRLLVKDHRDFKNASAAADVEQNNLVQKANIFEMTENDIENFALGKLPVALIPEPRTRAKSSRPPELDGIDGPFSSSNKDYLKRNQKENIREFINNGRDILITQITINDKIEETTHLKEFIESEEEQLKEGRRLFEEDKQKFNKY